MIDIFPPEAFANKTNKNILNGSQVAAVFCFLTTILRFLRKLMIYRPLLSIRSV